MDTANSSVEQYTCSNCGGKLVYAPGTTHLQCEQCQSTFPIATSSAPIEELDFEKHISGSLSEEDQITIHTVKCEACGANQTFESNVESATCVYCTTPLVVNHAMDEKIIRPKSLLPFKVTKKDARTGFKKWLTGFFWIPNKLKKAAVNTKHFQGGYLPFWTYDSDTGSQYTGQRGDYYYETETYQVNGETKTRRVRKTRWRSVSGHVHVPFDDILVGASNSVPEKYMRKLEPWDLPSLVPFDTQYLSGFVTEKYQVDLDEGWGKAKGIMNQAIRQAIERDIGGDEQRISQVTTQYRDTTFKHLLLPVYLSAYRYKDKLYQFFVNARTGEVQGQRPISVTKVVLAILFGLLLIGGILAAANWDAVVNWWQQVIGPSVTGPISQVAQIPFRLVEVLILVR